MSNPDQNPPRRGRAPYRRSNLGQGSSGRGSAPVPPVPEPEPPAPLPVGRGIASEIPPVVQSGVSGSGLGAVDPGLGGGSSAVLQIGGASGSGSAGPTGGVLQRKRPLEGDPGAGPSRPVMDDPPPPSQAEAGHPPPPSQAEAGHPPPPPPPPGAAAEEVHGLFFCNTCRRHFPTDRSLSGHLRSHGDRGYRGAFPPPVFDRQEFVDEGVEHLLNPLPAGGDAAGQGRAVVDPPAAGAGEVNVEQRGEAAAETSGAADRRLLDLNAPPPPDEDGDNVR